MTDLGELAFCHRILLDLDGLVNLADTEGAEVVLLPLGGSVLAFDLSYLKLCHNCSLLSVKNFIHGNSTETGHGVGVPHLGKSGNGSLHEVVRVGRTLTLREDILDAG